MCTWLDQELGQVSFDCRLWLRTDDGLDDLAVSEYLHGRDGGDPVLPRHLRVVINVELDDLYLVGVLSGNLVKNW